MNPKLIAPCGMNCCLCREYLREKRKYLCSCPGCRESDTDKPITCVRCIIKNCKILKQNKMKFCSDKCKNYPCDRLKRLDKRYRTKYGMSMIDNLKYIDKNGIKGFIKKEKNKWTRANKIFCVHDKEYYDCSCLH